MSLLIISSQMRSGSTFLTNLLASQENTHILPDFLHIERLKNISKADDLNTSLNKEQKNIIVRQFKSDCSIITNATGFIFNFNIESNEFNTLIEFYKLVFSGKVFSDKKKLLGHKTTNSESILRELLVSIDDLKCIYIVRDPRDVLISNKKNYTNASSLVYAYSILNNWKNGISNVGKVMDNNNKILVIRYEDLMYNPNETLDKISDFLKLEIIKPQDSIEWYENKFEHNSSFNDIVKLFDTSGVYRWKNEAKWVNHIALYHAKREMELYGYEINNGLSIYCTKTYIKYLLIRLTTSLNIFIDNQRKFIKKNTTTNSLTWKMFSKLSRLTTNLIRFLFRRLA